MDTTTVKELRDRTGISVMQCKEALDEAGGDVEEALKFLKEKGLVVAAKKADRALKSGTVTSYIHGGSDLGVMMELLCETDFVAKNNDFKTLAKDIAMHIAAMNPDTPEDLLKQEFIREPEKTIEELIKSNVQKFGENIDVGEFKRFSIGGR
jgi:elongation factor Ts